MTVIQFSKMLNNLSRCLDKAAAYADSKKFDSAVLLQTRLAPDQFNLVRQVQIACDNAKNGVSRLTGREAPKFEDTEQTVPELKARIEKVIGYLSTVGAQDFKGAEERKISLPYWNGKHLNGQEYFQQYLIPNFYFHVNAAYSILRNNGIDVGKSDYMGELPLKT
ncbi:MAG TPA: DUF1993 domain-containing protein [Polyangiaceae bacterium]|nr:DUF1993 domain-containing protein [Polyangiaceae bacterium]